MPLNLFTKIQVDLPKKTIQKVMVHFFPTKCHDVADFFEDGVPCVSPLSLYAAGLCKKAPPGEGLPSQGYPRWRCHHVGEGSTVRDAATQVTHDTRRGRRPFPPPPARERAP